MVGCLLSDASLQYNNNGQCCRMKMQQAEKNVAFLQATFVIMLPWSQLGPSFKRTTCNAIMAGELDTIKHEAFMKMANVFQDPSVPVKGNDCVQKYIPANIEEFLTPVAVAAWFCGDGGKADYRSHNNGKGIYMHTQGFKPEYVERLAQDKIVMAGRCYQNMTVFQKKEKNNMLYIFVLKLLMTFQKKLLLMLFLIL